MSSDAYLSLRTASEGIYKEKGSKFVAIAQSVQSEDEVESLLEDIRKEYPKARHYCYAYKIGFEGNRFRQYDEGEPSGTAGRPIFGRIEAAKLTNVLIVVIRYYGGTKLGASGLVHAYKTAAEEALKSADIIKKYRQKIFELQLPYEHFGSVMDALKSRNASILHQEFDDQPQLRISLPRSKGRKLIASSLEEVFSVPDLTWDQIPERTSATVREIDQSP